MLKDITTTETLSLKDGEQTVRIQPSDPDYCLLSGCAAEIVVADDDNVGGQTTLHLDDTNREILIRALGGEPW